MGFLEDVYAVSPMRETKQDAIDHYQRRHPGMGKNGWKQHIVRDLAKFTGMKPKSLEKRFDEQRRNNPEPRKADQYRKFGETLSPKPPPGGYYVSGTMSILYSDGSCEERNIEEMITGEDAETLLEASAENMLQMVINQYQNGDCRMAGPGPCGEEEPNLTVEPIEDEYAEAPYKDRRGWGHGRQDEYTADFTLPF